MRVLVFDTGTTGTKFIEGIPHNDDRQPAMTHIAAILCNDVGKVMASIDLPIIPNKWPAPTGAAAKKGIDYEKFNRYGVHRNYALHLFENLYNQSDILVGHNVSFDIDMIRRYSKDKNDMFLNDNKIKFDTMIGMQSYLQLSWSGKGYKYPSLTECYKFFFGIPFVGAHIPMRDVLATSDVYFEMVNKNMTRDGVIE